MTDFWATIGNFLTGDRLMIAVRATIIVVVGLILARLVRRYLGRIAERFADAHQAFVVRQVAYFTILAIVAVSVMRELGFDLSVLLGAAGILTVAVGFASQTSASNLISGLFLMSERPFGPGDAIKLGETVGEVLSIDLLSVKLRTFDNLFVRIPNETLIKSEVTNLTRFPIRRIDIKLGVAYKEDIRRVSRVLFDVSDKNPLCLEEPKPLLIFLGFGDSSIDLQFSVWGKRDNFLDLMNSIKIEIKEAFDANGIEIPFPHRSFYTGSVTDPLPIRVVHDSEPPPGS